MDLSAQHTPVQLNHMVLQSEKSHLLTNQNNNMGDTSLIQLRDAIDVIIGKLDEKIEASQRFSIKSKSSIAPGTGLLKQRQIKPYKERAVSNDFLTTNSKKKCSS